MMQLHGHETFQDLLKDVFAMHMGHRINEETKKSIRNHLLWGLNDFIDRKLEVSFPVENPGSMHVGCGDLFQNEITAKSLDLNV